MFNKNHRCCHDNLNSPVPAQYTLCPAALAMLPAAISSIGADILVCLPACHGATIKINGAAT